MSSQVLSTETVEWLKSSAAKYGTPGLAFAVVKLDGDEWKRQTWTHGIRNAKGDPWTEQSVLPMHSSTKMFTGLALGTLMHKDKPATPSGRALSWSTKIKDIWPDFETQDDYLTEHGTIDDFLGMRSGISGHGYVRRQDEVPADAYKYMRGHKLRAQPRELWEYYTNGMNMCSAIVPRCIGTPYPEYLGLLLKAIGAKNAHIGYSAQIRGETVDGFLRIGSEGTGKPVSVGWWCDALGAWNQGSGGLMMSIEDTSYVLQELLNPQVIPPEVVKRYITASGVSHTGPGPVGFNHTNLYSYVMGASRATYRNADCFGHSGSLDGNGCQWLIVPSRNVALFISVCEDSRLAAFRTEAMYRILDDLLGEKSTLPMTNPVMERLMALPKYAPDFPLEGAPDITGKYYDDVYRDMNIEAVDLAQPSPFATAVVQLFRWTPHANTVRFGKWFIAPQPTRAFVTHVLFEFVKDRQFNAYPAIIRRVHNDQDEPTDQWVGSLRAKHTALFLGNGVGMFEGWIGGKGSGASPSSIEGVDAGNIEKRADVFYKQAAQ